MGARLRILHVEDQAYDCELVTATLQSAGLDCEITRIQTREEFLEALDHGQFDVILSDFALPAFDGLTALELAQARLPMVPFLIVSGSMGEDAAIESLKSGATDYVLKHRLDRLPTAVQRAIAHAREKEARLKAEAERKAAQERVREQAALLDNARDAIFVLDLDRRITYWNASAAHLFGWSKEEACGQVITSLGWIEDLRQFEAALQQVSKKKEWNGELRFKTRNNQEVVIQSRWTLTLDEKEKPKAILILNTDITEKKMLETQFLRAQRLESIGTLAGGIAHDLNNALSPILMAIQLLRMKYDDPEAEKLLETMENSAQRGAGMVRQILSFARGVQGERILVQFKPLITEMLKVIKETFPKTMQIHFHCETDLWPIKADATQMHQVLMNLCVNARDAMAKGGTIRIDAANIVVDESYARQHLDAKPGKYVSLTVTDTGSGIPPHIIDKIFDPFFTTKPLNQGTGLGLSTVLGIVKSHGGFLNVYSELGRGSRFKVFLPAHLANGAPATEEPPPISIPPGQNERILIIDDEPAIREISKAMLESHGYVVNTASDGTEALAIFASQQPFDLVITDMAMPFMDGPATIRVLRKLNPEIPLIVMSGLAENVRWNEISSLSNVVLLEKPFTSESLLHTVSARLANRPPASPKSPGQMIG